MLWSYSGVFIVNFEHILHHVLVFLLLFEHATFGGLVLNILVNGLNSFNAKVAII